MNNKKQLIGFHRIYEAIKTAILALLVVTLVILVSVYVSGTRVFENAVADKEDPGANYDKLWSVIGGTEPEGLDSALLLPEFIGYKQAISESATGCMGNYAAATEMYSLVKPCIIELFGNGSVCRRLPENTGSKIFAAAQQSDEFVYIRYHEPVLYQLIYAYAAEALTVSEGDLASSAQGNIGAYISDLIIVPDNNFAAHRFIAYAYDDFGTYYEFRPGEDVVSSDFYISKLADSTENTVLFEFVSVNGSDIAMPFAMKQLECDVIAGEAVTLEEGETRNELLRFLGYNPDKLDVFEDEEEGTYVYIDSHSRLKLGNGILSFLASDEIASAGETLRGISINDMLGYSNEGTTTLFDKLTAVDNLIGRLYEIAPMLMGGEGMLCLGDVYTDGSLLVIEYILTYNNIRVGAEPYLRAVLTDDTVCELEIGMRAISASEDTTLAVLPDYVLRGLIASGRITDDSRVDSVKLCYLDDSARWVIELKQ